MKVSTSTSLYHINLLEKKKYTIEQSLDICKDAGFEYVDFNFYDHGLEGEMLTKTNWLERIKEVREYADKIGLKFNQTHSFCYRTKEATDPSIDHEWYAELIKRSIIGTEILGASWTVVHPNSYMDEEYCREKNFKFNHDYWKQFVQLGEQMKVGIAFENMFESSSVGRYCSNVDELIELIDSYESDYVGACWDTGHAHLAGVNQKKSIIKLGDRLKTLHINDNNNVNAKDEHLIPYYGTIDWDEIIIGLKKINYKNDFAYELKFATQVMPTFVDVEFGSFLKTLADKMILNYGVEE